MLILPRISKYSEEIDYIKFQKRYNQKSISENIIIKFRKKT
jgi:hypothetical protein